MSERALKKDWEVTPEAFEKLLYWLDPDPNAAGTKYEIVRQKLVKLFKWRNCVPEEEYADITINRVTRRIWESADVEVADPYLYFHGTALNVLREYWRGQLKHRHESIDEQTWRGPTVKDAEQLAADEADRAAGESKHRCMKECIAGLPDDSRELIVAYHNSVNKIEARRTIAERLDISINVLRIRACRIRDGLRACVGRCVGKI